MHPQLQAGRMDAMDNLGVLLLELFELYGSAFNYESVGLSIAGRGRYFRKVCRHEYTPSKCSVCSHSHCRYRHSARRQVDRGWAQAGRHSLLSIEDPQDQSMHVRLASMLICHHAEHRRAISCRSGHRRQRHFCWIIQCPASAASDGARYGHRVLSTAPTMRSHAAFPWFFARHVWHGLAYHLLTGEIISRKNRRSLSGEPVTLLGLIIQLDHRSTTFRQAMSERFDRMLALENGASEA